MEKTYTFTVRDYSEEIEKLKFKEKECNRANKILEKKKSAILPNHYAAINAYLSTIAKAVEKIIQGPFCSPRYRVYVNFFNGKYDLYIDSNRFVWDSSTNDFKLDYGSLNCPKEEALLQLLKDWSFLKENITKEINQYIKTTEETYTKKTTEYQLIINLIDNFEI